MMMDIYYSCIVAYLIAFSYVFSFLYVSQPPPIKPSDDQLTLSDLDVVKVIGKGAGGVVQLVQHKWTRQFFALKVITALK